MDPAAVKAHFGRVLRRQVTEVLGIPEAEAVTWLSSHLDCRWQTAQFWFKGESMPSSTARLAAVAKLVHLDVRDLVGDDAEEPTTDAWRRFLLTPEGRSMTPEERFALSLFSWPNEADVGDYRSLLALRRANADRS